MIKTYKCEGIVIARRNLGEADKLVSLLTRQFGRKVVLAKGVRRIHSRRSPHLEMFTYVDLLIRTGKTFDTVSEVVPFENFSYIRYKLERVGFVYIALELVNRMTAENQEVRGVFLLLLDFLRRLNDPSLTRKDAYLCLTAFKKTLLSELGFTKRESLVAHLDKTIEQILEGRLKSPALLTRIQSHA